MNGYNFTDRVRKVLQMARDEAARLHHEYIGTEHILLGLIQEGEGVAVAVLTNLNVDIVQVRQTIEGFTIKAKTSDVAGPDLPYTSRAKKVLEYSMSEARELHHAYVGTEHLLLGLLREKVGIAAQVLIDAGASLETVRAETLRLLGTPEFMPEVRNQPSPREGLPRTYSFLNEFRRSLFMAREEATRLGSDHVDAVHIALAILGMKDGAAVAELTALGVDAAALRDNLLSKLGNREGNVAGDQDLPYTGQARNVLELAMVEARELHHPDVGTGHLLLALLREGVLDIPNVSLSQVRSKVAGFSSRGSRFGFAVRLSTLRLVGGMVFILSGAEAMWYAPGFLGKALGLLGACGGLLMIALWFSDRR